MTKIAIHPKKLPKFTARDNLNDYILRIDHERLKSDGSSMVTDVIAFEWHSAGMYNAVGKYHCVHGLKVPVRFIWDAIDAFGKPDKAIRTDGTSFWIMNSYYDRETGLCNRLEGGNSSPFTIITRDTLTVEEEI
ncbi:hypothetical protein PP940_gp078 [Rhizobium phage RL2RES]|uniref:Uncharacterized protein n=1 Tax=Rhizobium phage RL2RES TaxID=103371 RepID=A0A6B9J1Q8_9CAUD|nr:hypothetical protein PP940_gp078 [Rhizobium phage RL2RES]QGZ14214.1 hypothetical protein RL2RES_078 [Rhizobium phage RL2RES]